MSSKAFILAGIVVGAIVSMEDPSTSTAPQDEQDLIGKRKSIRLSAVNRQMSEICEESKS